MPESAPRRTAVDRAIVWLLCLYTVLVPVNLVWPPYGRVGPYSPGTTPYATPADVALWLLCLVGCRVFVTDVWSRRLSRATTALIVLTVLVAVSLAVHPTSGGLHQLLRAVGATVAVWAVRRTFLLGRQYPLLIALGAAGVFQGLLAIMQVRTGVAMGLERLGELPPYRFDGGYRAVGTFDHPYRLAGFALVCTAALVVTRVPHRYRNLHLLVIAVAAVPIGLTYARMSVISLLLMALVVVNARRPSRRSLFLPCCALAVGVLVPSIATLDGWTARAIDSVQGRDGQGVASGRAELTSQAIDIIGRQPLTGVGPGRYREAVAEESASVDIVHSVPLLLAAESGVPAGATMLALIVLLFRRHRAGAPSNLLGAAYLPFMMLDVPYPLAQGFGIVVLWIGLTDSAGATALDRDVAPQGRKRGIPGPTGAVLTAVAQKPESRASA